MLELFRNNLFINSFLLLPYIILVRIHTLIYPEAYNFTDDSSSYFVHLLLGNFTDPLVQSLASIFLIFIQALILNYIFIKNKLSRESTLFTGMVYVLIMSVTPANNVLSPILIANTFLILGILNIFECYKKASASAVIFNSGFFIGLASIFYIPYIIFVFFGVISLILLRSFKIIEKLQYFSGVIATYYLLLTFFYWKDIDFQKLDILEGLFFKIPIIQTSESYLLLISPFIIFLLIIVVVLNYNSYISRKNIQVQKKIDIIFWCMLFCFLSVLMFKTQQQFHLLSLAIPLSMLIAVNLSESKRSIVFELVHILVLIVIGITHFGITSG